MNKHDLQLRRLFDAATNTDQSLLISDFAEILSELLTKSPDTVGFHYVVKDSRPTEKRLFAIRKTSKCFGLAFEYNSVY